MQKRFTMLVLAVLTCAMMAAGSAAIAQSFVIDKTQPGGGDCAAAGGTWKNPSTCKFSNTTLGPVFSTVTVQPSTTVEVLDFVVMQLSTLIILGELYVDDDASLQNNGLLENRPGGSIVIDGNMDVNRDPVENEGTLTINGMLTLNTSGILNRAGAQIFNNGSILSFDDTINHGTITNNATGSITHVSSPDGNTISNFNIIVNDGAISNTGEIVNFCSATLTGNPVTGNPVVGGMTLEEIDDNGFSWCDPAGASPFLVLTGDIHDLLAFKGDLDGSMVECRESVAGPPAAHGVEADLFFLVMPENEGSWNSGGRFQVGNRTVACPTCNCCTGGDGAGCNREDCEALVCDVDPFCCEDTWDDICDVEGTTLCSCCDPGPPDLNEPNNTAGIATKISCPSHVTSLAKIWLAGEDVDFYSLTGPPGATIVIDLDADEIGSTLDTVLGAFDSSLVELAISDDDAAPGEPATFDSYLSVVMPVNGFLYIAVTSFEDLDFNGGEEHVSFGPYTMTVDCQ